TESVDNLKDLAEKNNINKSSGQSSTKEAVVVIDGTGYLGYLSFTGYGKVLPVLADWSFENLQYAPARFSGSVIDNNLVIAAHNYFSHFYLLNEMTEGNEVILTLPDGKEIHYIVDKIERLSPTELDKLTAGDYDLTLFTCTPTGLARATVRCNKI
ncbi:MAG: sortase, partial [Ruminococcus sp.]